MKYAIGSTLKKKRRQAKLKVENVTDFLRENGVNVAHKTIYGWENESAFPSINTFLLLCELYEIEDVLKTFKKDSSE